MPPVTGRLCVLPHTPYGGGWGCWAAGGGSVIKASQLLLDELDPATRAAVVKRLRVIRAPKGRTILGTGAGSADVYFVEDGRIRISLYATDGKEVSVRDLDAGDLFGELSAIDGLPRSANAVALTDVRLLAMSRGDFAVCLATPAADRWLKARLVTEVRRLTEKLFELSALNIQSRLHCELLRLARHADSAGIVSASPTHAELARRIGANREAVTREIGVLTNMGLLRQSGRTLTFLDIDRLEREVARRSHLANGE